MRRSNHVHSLRVMGAHELAEHVPLCLETNTSCLRVMLLVVTQHTGAMRPPVTRASQSILFMPAAGSGDRSTDGVD